MEEQLSLKLPISTKQVDPIDVQVCEETLPSLEGVEEGWADILISLGIDLTDPNFFDTPKRVAKSYSELLYGLFPAAKKEIETQLSITFPCDYKGMIIIDNIHTWSFCPHHMLPVSYTINIGYIPDGVVLGASKLPRLATLLSKRPVLQEDLTQDIVEHLQKVAKPKGVICTVHGKHLCMSSRGIKQENSSMITSSVTGIFLTNEGDCKEEFFTLLNAKK
jgi:GTP cyclohydrolase IA